jgi:hypothetical protein
MRRIVLPVAAYGALALMVGCGGTSGGGTNPGVGTNAPLVNGAQPPTGSPSGGTFVTLTGSGFLVDVVGPTTVTFAGAQATNVVVVDDQTITLSTPPHVGDAFVDVKVTNSRGIGTLGSGFQYLATASIISDLNSDGIPDIAIAATLDGSAGVASGAVYVFFGSDAGPILADRMAGQADLVIRGVSEGDQFGASLQTGDVNADGHTDLIIGASASDSPAIDAGQVSIFLGPLPAAGLLDAPSADITLSGEGTVAGAWWGVMGDSFGTALSLGDVNGDSVLDILVGAPGVDLNVGQASLMKDAGRAYLFLGGAQLDSRGAAQADMIVSGVREQDQLGSEVCLADLNSDGQVDLAIAFDVFVSGPTHGARVAILTQGVLASATSDDATLVLRSAQNGDRFGTSVVCGDVNQDGSMDLVVGAPLNSSLASGAGRAYLFLGAPGLTGNILAGDADAIYSGYLGSMLLGSRVAAADVNGDGFADVIAGAPQANAGASWSGQVFVFNGQNSPVDTVAFASDVALSGEVVDGGRFGSAIEVLDANMDGIADLMSSATGVGASAGRVYVFTGEESLLDQSASADAMTLSGESANAKFGSSISRGK